MWLAPVEETSVRSIRSFVCLLAAFPLPVALHGQKPAVVYADGHAVVFATAEGKVLRRTPVTVDIGAIAFSPASGRLVIQSAGMWGGKLYLVEPGTGHLRLLIAKPLFFKNLTRRDRELSKSERDEINRTEHEVYADPEFDPTGNLLVFAVHNSGPGAWDAVEAAGPLAIYDMRTSAVHVLESSLLKEEHGPAYSNHPHWSPDGTRILMNHEESSELLDAGGKAHTYLGDMFGLAEDENGYGECWLDEHSILYAVYSGEPGSDPNRFAVLDLDSHRLRPAAEFLGLDPKIFSGAQDIGASGSIIVIRYKDKAMMYSRESHQLLFVHSLSTESIEPVAP
jgi:hypothetical protein